jgi:hypothetical protein
MKNKTGMVRRIDFIKLGINAGRDERQGLTGRFQCKLSSLLQRQDIHRQETTMAFG